MARQPTDSSSSSTLPPAKIVAHPTALISQDTNLKGPGSITFGPGCIVHPRASIHAVGGDIAFGKDCVVEEGASIVHNETGLMQIGEGNMFMVRCHIESPSIGNFNTFQPRCQVSPYIAITNHCTISAGCKLLPDPTTLQGATLSSATTGTGIEANQTQESEAIQIDEETTPPDERVDETLPLYTVVYGSENQRRLWDGAGQEAEDMLRVKHIEYLREILPKYNRMRPT